MPAARRARLVDALVETFTARLPYKAAALLFAGAIWLAVSGAEPRELIVAVRVAPTLDPAVRLAGAAPRVRAVVTGPLRELLKLYAAPPVLRLTLPGDLPDSLAVELHARDVTLPGAVSGVRVRELRPRRLALRFARAAPPDGPISRPVAADVGGAPLAEPPAAVAAPGAGVSPAAPPPSAPRPAPPAARPDSGPLAPPPAEPTSEPGAPDTPPPGRAAG